MFPELTLDVSPDATTTQRKQLAISPSDMRELLTCLPPLDNEFAFIVENCRVIHVNKKMRKYFVECRLRVRDIATGRRRTVAAIAKVYARDRGAYPYKVLTYLWERGFRDETAYAVPQPLAYLPERRMLLQAKALGAPLADYLHQPEAGPLGAKAAARWLACLHRLPPETGFFPRAEPTTALNRYHCELREALSPAQATRLDRLFTCLLDLFQRSAAEDPLVFIHGDYHAKNVFLSDGRVTVIDFDTFGLGEPAGDLGYFLAQNAIMAWLRHRSLLLAKAPSQAFVEEYAAQGGILLWPRVTAYIARTFLQSLHYELCVLHTGNLELVDLWLSHMEDALDRTNMEIAWSPLV